MGRLCRHSLIEDNQGVDDRADKGLNLNALDLGSRRTYPPPCGWLAKPAYAGYAMLGRIRALLGCNSFGRV